MTTTSSAAPRLWPANGLGALFDIGAGSHRRAVAVLVLISLVLFLPGFFQISAGRSRRGLFRASHQADDRNRRLCRHPLSRRRSLPQTGRHLLAASRGGEDGRDFPFSQCANHHLALPHPVAPWRRRRGSGHLLVRARLRLPARRHPGRDHDGGFDAARRRSAARQDRRRAACSPSSPPWACWRAPISRRARPATRGSAGHCRRSFGPRSPPAS